MKYFDREIQKVLMKYLEVPEAIIILGSRQVGKTTLLKIIMGKIASPERSFYLDLEYPENLEIVEGGPVVPLLWVFK